MKKRCFFYASIFLTLAVIGLSSAQAQTASPHPIVLHAARLLDIENGKIVAPAEILVQGERIVEVGTTVSHPAGAEIIDLGDRTLLPGMIDAHVHLFLHPGAEDLQTVEESVPQRTIIATLAARDDLMAGFTAERDMGTEGAGSAATAVRNAITQGLIPGPLHAARAGVASIDHAVQLSDETMRLIREKQMFAVPTFSVAEYFANHAGSPAESERRRQSLDFRAQEFRKQLAAGVPMDLGS